ncbi:disease resistance protein [Pyrus ussuriensis x Pyrus communis]|uniref:Disease resistance protein n=1 Tax=Pyrus ussuriensis x Pyrus communis TaxID=2448454 RepID=A0A5N5FV69_9ROSA|nr:disease resistance protein [Pyrus ussuriensis x Pyrus communis]
MATDIIIAIGSKIGECLVTPIGTEFGYLFNYHSNLESLRGEIKKLFDKKDGVQGLVDAAKRNGEIIKPDVQSWLKNVNDDMVKKVLQFEDEINKKRRCVYRWSLSRKTYKITQHVLQLQNEGAFENVGHPAPPRGICPSVKTIQSEIAGQIGLKLDEDPESVRALKLYGRLTEIKRILIVLDDVWTELDFKAIGLPYEHTNKGCKILLTSRNLEVCNEMRSQQIIEVRTLTTEESEELFREMTMNGRFSKGSMDIICDAMKELKVLALVGMAMEDLGSSRSPGVLKNLRTLILDGSDFDGMSTDVIGPLENLEILSFRDCFYMCELPREIGRLKQLRLLDTTNCKNLKVIPHGREDKRMASISEVMSLSDHLKVLSINVIHLLPKDIVLKNPTIKFRICLGTGAEGFCQMIDRYAESDARKELMESQAVGLMLKKSKKLALRNVKNFSALTDLDEEGFQDLKVLYLDDCPNTEYLVNGTSALFPRIQSASQLPNSFLTNLRFLRLSDCGVLKYAFSLSVVRNLVQLEELDIGGCDQMEEIVLKQGREHNEEADMISFHKLTNLNLGYLQSLAGFFQANKLYSNQEVCPTLQSL